MRTKLLSILILITFGFSNITFGQNCISNVLVEQDDCTPFGNYTAFVSFDHSPNVDSVSLFFDGEFFGNHSAEFQPIVLAELPFNPTGNNTHDIELVSTASTTCRDSISFDAVCIFGSDDCLSELFFADAFCIDSTLQFEINYTFLNPVSEGHIYVNDEFIANATIGENQSFTFSVDNINPQSVYEIVVRDAEFLACGDTLTTQVAPCMENCTDEFDLTTSCNSDGTFDVSFFHQDSVMTKLYLNDQFISRIIPGQSNNPFLIEGVDTDPTRGDFTVTTCLVSNPTCCRTVTFDQPACNPCNISLSLNEVFCEGFFPVFDINYTVENPTNAAQLIVNGSPISQIDPGLDVPFLLNPQIINDQGTYIIELVDPNSPSCGDTLIINDFFCDQCIVETSNIETECLAGTDNYLIELDIFNSGSAQVNEYSILHQTGQFFGPFTNTGASGVVNVSFEVPTSLQGQFQIIDPMGICTAFFTTEVDCNPNTDCAITNVLLDHQCLDAFTFEAFIQFETSNVTGGFVEIFDFNQTSFGLFDVNQQPIIITVPTSGQGIEPFGITIVNPMDPECVAESNIIGIDCDTTEPCEVAFIEILDTECNPDGTYNLSVNYDINIASAMEITVNVNGINYDVIPNPNLVFTIEGITPRANSDEDIITICSQEFMNCCNVQEYPQPNCTTNSTCEIGFIEYDAVCLDSAGAFMVNLFFTHENTSGEVVVSSFSGAPLGQFDVNQQPITVGPFGPDDLDNNGIGFLVCDAQIQGCCQEVFAENINCEINVEPCSIEFIEIISRECNSDGTYNLTATYDISNPDSDFINVTVNGGPELSFENTGTLVVNNLTPRQNSDFDIIEICVSGNANCCLVNEYLQPNCMTNDVCAIGGLEYEAICIDSAGAFMVNLFFDHENTSGEVVVSNFNGVTLGQFDVNQQPITVGPFGQDDLDNNGIGFLVCDAQIQGCCEEVFADNIPCMINTGICEVEFIEIISRECNSDGTYNLTATYSIANGNNDFIDVTVNGGEVLSFDNTGTVTVTNITPRPNSDFDIIEICLNDNADCCLVNEYLQPDCSMDDDCTIGGLEYEAICLDSTGSFMINLFFNQVNTSGEVIVTTFTGDPLGQFDAGQQPILVGPFTQSDLDDNGIGFIICDAQIDGCCAEVFATNIPCNIGSGEPCAIEFIEVISRECNSDGTYNLTVEYNITNGNNNFIDVSVNGGQVQSFENIGSLTVTNITARTTSDFDIIEICLNDNPDCCQETEYLQPDCTAEPQECDLLIGDLGFFCNQDDEIFFELDVFTSSTNEFMVFINGVQLENETPNGMLTVVGPFPQTPTGAYLIEIIDIDDATCRSEFEVIQAICTQECFVGDIIVDIECSDEETFTAIITFPYDADHQDGVRIRGNGVNYGIFDGFTQPIFIESLVASANTNWEFIVTDVQNANCRAVAEVGAIDCTNEDIQCIIEDIEVFNLECIGDNEYAMSVNFETGSNANLPFSFFVNGVLMNSATTNSLPLNVFGVVPNSTSTIDVITVCLDDFDGQCCVDFAYDQPACLSNAVDATLIDGVSMSPNPTTDMLYINDIPNEIIGLNVIDNLGRKLVQISSQNNVQLDVSSYQNGIYTIQFFTQDNRIMSRRFVKM